MDKAAADVVQRQGIERAMRHIAGSQEWVRITRLPAPACRKRRQRAHAARYPRRVRRPGPRSWARKEARDGAAKRAASHAAADEAFPRLSRYARDAQRRPRRRSRAAILRSSRPRFS
jgi:hypothetical protein